MRDLNFELSKLCKRNQDGAFATQRDRSYILDQCASELHGLGFRNLSINGLKPKHVEALIAYWQVKEIGTGSIKNRMVQLRWWSEKIGKSSMMRRSNADYQIEGRAYVTNRDKSVTLDGRLDQVRDQYTQMSLRLQAAFGLRREESIKFSPQYADRGDHIVLKHSWTKGGKERSIPILNEDQRRLLDECRKMAGTGSLIPPHKNYVKQLRTYEQATKMAGFHKMHGLRHRYAQQRYEQLTGWKAPVQDGPRRSELNKENRYIDQQARLEISRELGHERIEIVAIYCGS